MIKLISRLVRNQRRQNSWIFLELLLISYCVWLMVDPLYIKTANYCIDFGYNEERVYFVDMEVFWGKVIQNSEENIRHLWHIADIIKSQPEVERFAIYHKNHYPNSNNAYNLGYICDSVERIIPTYMVLTYGGSDFFNTFGIRKENSQEVIEYDAAKSSGRELFLTRDVADKLYPKGDFLGEELKSYMDELNYRIVGIMHPIKTKSDRQPSWQAIQLVHGQSFHEGASWSLEVPGIAIRIKPEVDVKEFEKRFTIEVGPSLTMGVFCYKGLTSMKKSRQMDEELWGLYDVFRLRIGLLTFALLCLFLGIFSTFWLRIKQRRAEVGLMRAMGASSSKIIQQFLLESWILYTAAFAVALIVQMNRVHAFGFAYEAPNLETSVQYWRNQPIPHFFMVSGITYLLLLIVVCISTYIPVRKTAKELPAETLRGQ